MGDSFLLQWDVLKHDAYWVAEELLCFVVALIQFNRHWQDLGADKTFLYFSDLYNLFEQCWVKWQVGNTTPP